MQFFQLFFYCLLFYVHIISAIEYMYPVASYDHGKTILYIHQQSSTHLELYELNTQTNQKEQILWSMFNPANLQLLPHNMGFSFIDNGRLRIKFFQKRSPKAIDFDEPLFNFNNICWIDEYNCYCSAQCGDYCSLFELHSDGTSRCLITQNDKDCLYPQKIDGLLFYIERYTVDNIWKYQIIQSSYPDENMSFPFLSLIDFKDKPIAFLTMQSDREGFVLEHEKTIDSNLPITQFWYHHIIKKDDKWCKKCLFSFLIPTELLLPGEYQIYESILPLLPQRINDKIYFVDCSKNDQNTLEPYTYDISANLIQKVVVPTKFGHYFVPVLCGERFYCGGNPPLVSFLT